MNCVFLFVFFLLDWLPPIPRQFLTSSREWPACQVTILCDSGVPVSTPLFHIKKTLLYETLLPKQTTRGLLHALRLKTVQVIYCSLCSKSVDGKGGGVWLKKIVTYIFFNLFLFLIPFANICLSLDILQTETFLRVPYVTKRIVVILGTPYACDNICLRKKKSPFI